MFGLLCLPNFAKPFITGLAFANFAHLRVKILQPPAFCVRRNFDGAFFWNERHLIVDVLICRAVKDRTDSFADSHVVKTPVGIEQDPVTVFGAAVYERNQQQSSVATQDFLNPSCYDNAAGELELRLFTLNNSERMQLIIREHLWRC